jgi:cytoskeletal protein CcmA (bactofilin family)
MRGILLCLSLLILPASVSALGLRAGDQVSLTETILEDTYVAGGSVSQIAPINGDLFVAGGQVLSQGDISGDLFIAGGGVTTVGTTSDDVRIAGGNVTVHGAVLGDVVVFGGQVLVSGAVRGDVIAYGGTVRIAAPVRGDVRAGGGTVTIDAPIAGRVTLDAEKVELTKRAKIGGDLNYTAVTEVSVPQEASVGGTIKYTPCVNVREVAEQGLIAFLSLWFVLKFFMLLSGSLLISYFFNAYALDLVLRCRAKPVQEFALGLATMIALPVVSLFLLVTIIGLPIGLLGLLSFSGLGILAHLIGPIVFGSFLFAWLFSTAPTVNWKTTLVGATLFYFIWFIPFAGWLARAFFFFLVIGATVSFKWDIARKWH